MRSVVGGAVRGRSCGLKMVVLCGVGGARASGVVTAPVRTGCLQLFPWLWRAAPIPPRSTHALLET